MNTATGITTEEEIRNKLAKQMSAEEQISYSFYIRQCDKAREQRDDRRRELNNVTFLTDDQTNRDNRNSYIRPKKNDNEVRLNTGTVEKKCLTVVNEILSYNFQSEVVAYDQEDREVVETGDCFADVVRRTNEQENDDDLKFPSLWDLTTRRIMFMEEYWEEKNVVDKRKKKYDLENGVVEFDKQEFRMSRPRKRLIDPRTIYAGDVSIPVHRWDDQPFIVKYDCKSYREAKTIFGNYKNWKYVQPGKGTMEWYGGEFIWRFDSSGIDDDSVEIIYYYSFPDDEWQILMNGVMMLNPGTPLPWEYEGYSIKAFVFREMEQNYLYGQLFTVNAKVWAGLKDEMLRLIVRKWRQLVDPPSGVAANKVLSKDVWDPGTRVSGLKPEDVFPLIKDNQFSAGEQLIYQQVSSQVDSEVGVTDLFQGQGDKKLTATQATEQLKQAIKSIGLLVDAWRRVVRDMTYLRIYNVIENGVDPLDVKLVQGKAQKIYRSFTIKDTELENGLTGTKVVQFVDDHNMTPEDEDLRIDAMDKAEEELERAGKNVRFKDIKSTKLRAVRLNWFVNVLPKEKDSTALQKTMFKEELNDAIVVSKIAGRPIKGSTVVEKYERVWKSKNMFEEAPPQQMAAMGAPAEGEEGSEDIKSKASAMASKVGAEMQQSMGQPAQSPSVNTLSDQI